MLGIWIANYLALLGPSGKHFHTVIVLHLQIYKILIRPVVTYGSETWTLTKSDESLLRIFERKILRKMNGPIQEGDIWRIRDNEELNRSINERVL